MTVRFLPSMKPLAGLLAFAAIAACSDSTGSNKVPVKLSFTTRPAGTAIVAADINVGAPGELVLSSVQVVVDKIELDRTGVEDCVGEIEDSGDDHAHIEGECEDVARDPVLVDLPVDGSLHAVLNVPLTPGTYSEIEAKLEPARADATAFNAANPNMVGNSVRVVGTYKGNAFVFTTSVRTSLEMEFDPPLVVDATTNNTTIDIDVSKWFIDSNGAVIDPRTATPGSAALQKIEDNIHRSFHAFEDEHETGIDDHSGHDG